jgi:hypothetical protein
MIEKSCLVSKDCKPFQMSYMRMNRFKKKSTKQPTSEKPPYLLYNPHTLPAPVAVEEMISPSGELDTWVQIGSIDPGPKNTGMRIEKRWVKSTQIFNKIDRSQVIIPCIDMILYTIMDSTIDIATYNTSDPTAASYHVNNILLMDKFLDMLCDCHYIVIESQMTFNTEATRFGQHLITYLLIKCKDKGNRPLIIEMDSHHKTRLLGAPKLNIAKKEHKKWCLERAIQMFTLRNDTASLQFLNFIRKKDDCGDAACQIEVWWMILNGLYVPPQPQPKTKKLTKAQVAAQHIVNNDTPVVYQGNNTHHQVPAIGYQPVQPPIVNTGPAIRYPTQLVIENPSPPVNKLVQLEIEVDTPINRYPQAPILNITRLPVPNIILQKPRPQATLTIE